MSTDILPFFDSRGRTVGLFGELTAKASWAAAEAILRFRSASTRKQIQLYLGSKAGSADDVAPVLDAISICQRQILSIAWTGLSGAGLLAFLECKRRQMMPCASLDISFCPIESKAIGFGSIPNGKPLAKSDHSISIESHLGWQILNELQASGISRLGASQAREMGLATIVPHHKGDEKVCCKTSFHER